jgi:hypothetical protein
MSRSWRARAEYFRERLSQGVDVVSVSRLLGHNWPITLSVYSHAIRSVRAGLPNKLAW